MNRATNTKFNTRRGELNRLGQAGLLVYGGDEACQGDQPTSTPVREDDQGNSPTTNGRTTTDSGL